VVEPIYCGCAFDLWKINCTHKFEWDCGECEEAGYWNQRCSLFCQWALICLIRGRKNTQIYAFYDGH
jgi:hypothetical protein